MFLSETQIGNPGFFFLSIVLGATAFSANLTLMSAIAAKAENKTTLLAVLSFPLIVPILLTLIRLTQKAINGLGVVDGSDQILMVGGITAVLTAVSVILFPFIWKD